MTTHPTPVSAVILTYNEADNLPGCLATLAGWVAEIILVDSLSTDATLDIGRSYDARIYQNPFITHPLQLQWAMDHTQVSFEWILLLDADFRITPLLQKSIVDAIQRNSPEIDAYLVKRLQVFRGKPLRHGGLYTRKEIRLARTRRIRIHTHEGVDLRISVPGRVDELAGDLIEDNAKERRISFWLQKHDGYSERQAQQEYERLQRAIDLPELPRFFGTPSQRKLWLKERWYRLPLYWRPLFYFLYRYFLRLGFLDGKQGFIYHFLQAYWYRLIVDIKLEELLSGDKPPLAKNDLI